MLNPITPKVAKEWDKLSMEERERHLLDTASYYEEGARIIRAGVARAERERQSPSGEIN